MRKTKVVLIGAGFIADIHAESFRRFVPDADIVGVYSRREDHARAFAHKHRIPRWFTDINEPLCLTLEEADAMIAACKAHNRKRKRSIRDTRRRAAKTDAPSSKW